MWKQSFSSKENTAKSLGYPIEKAGKTSLEIINSLYELEGSLIH